MKSIYDLLLEWHQIDPNFIFLRDKKSYTLNEVVHEVEISTFIYSIRDYSNLSII